MSTEYKRAKTRAPELLKWRPKPIPKPKKKIKTYTQKPPGIKGGTPNYKFVLRKVENFRKFCLESFILKPFIMPKEYP